MPKVLTAPAMSRCIGCYSCMLACARLNYASYSPRHAALQIRTQGGLQGARHSHVDNGGYSLDQKPRELSDEEIVDGLIAEEQERNALNSLAICMFARKVYDHQTVLAALGATGMQMSEEEWVALGRRIYREKAALKESFGFSYRTLKAPARFFETPTPRGRLDPARLERLLALFNERLHAIKRGAA